jgi:hypothetical protein
MSFFLRILLFSKESNVDRYDERREDFFLIYRIINVSVSELIELLPEAK